MDTLKDQIENIIDNIEVDYERHETHIDAYVINGKETVEHLYKVFLDQNKELIEAMKNVIYAFWGDESLEDYQKDRLLLAKQVIEKTQV